jgi:hypothetical protein
MKNIHFLQIDPHNIPKNTFGMDGNSISMNNFDVIFCIELLDNLRNPTLVLNYLSSIQKAGNYLVISSSYNWNENITPKINWIYENNSLKNILNEYELINIDNINFLTQLDKRNFNFKNSELTIWKRK